MSDDLNLDDLNLDDLGLNDPPPKRSGKTKSSGSSKSRRSTFFLVGLVLGVVGTIFVPGLVAPYLPPALRGLSVELEGEVLAKQRENGDADRLLITVGVKEGAVLATFTERVSEIDLLVDKGDRVTLGVREYEPFVEDPALRGVVKAVPEEPAAEESAVEDPEVEDPAGAQPDSATDTTDGETGDAESAPPDDGR